jgi:hypothetical protein
LPSGRWQAAQLAVDLLAARHQFLQLPDLGRVVGSGGHFLLLAVDPLGVVGLAQHLHVDRHVGVLLAAQLGALAVEVAGLLGAEPGVAHEAGDGVLLDAQAGTIQAWITSLAVVTMRTFLSTGTTSGLSTFSR